MNSQQIGIIDMGSNSVRFVIYEVDRYACFREVQNLKVTARLSTYIDDEGSMNEEGIQLILNILERFEKVADNYSLTSIKGAATAAVRNAANRDEIMAAVMEGSSFPFDVLSEEEEAYYGYLAVTNSTDIEEGVTIDIGGGSTEITYFKDRELQQSISFPFGALTLKKQFIESDTPDEKEWKKLKQFLANSYETLEWLADKDVPVIGIGGSARNLALVHQEMIGYPLSGLHQYRMSNDEMKETIDSLLDMSMKKREKIDGLSKDRADIILPAAAAMQMLMKVTGGGPFIVSTKGLRDGMFFEEMLRSIEVTHFPNVKEESFYQLSNHYRLNNAHQRRITILSAYLLNELQKRGAIEVNPEQARLLRLSASIFYIGEKIHPESKSQHTFYLLTNQSIDGMTHQERLAVAFTSSFKSKSYLKQFANPFREWISKDDLKLYELLGAINKFSYALNISEQSSITKVEVVKMNKSSLTLQVYYQGDIYFEAEQANKYKKHLERPLKRNIDLVFTQEDPPAS
ncbi:Ppx/GppA family phosphatase [Bacillus daqingensis]|uniref:Ppx/GppA family phosphatase n=1 Tax=Bacillus daqingensis TaxID=872396 RepID=A0ABV9P1G1_9BACI